MTDGLFQRAHCVIVGLALALASSMLSAAPFAYSVNSDAEVNADRLYELDLATGEVIEVGDSGFEDIEGLAFSTSGQLFGVDDASDSVVRFDMTTGAASPIGSGLGNLGLSGVQDYGLTFICDGEMFIASDNERSLYRTNLQSSQPTLVGSAGSLGVRITGLAAWGDDVYGIGSEGGEGIYRVDTDSGQTTQVMGLPGYSFTDGGIAFDEKGILWALLDKSFLPFRDEPSIILRIDLDALSVTQTATTLEGFESLAIVANTGCEPQGPPPEAVPVPSVSSFGLLLMALGLIWLGFRRPTPSS